MDFSKYPIIPKTYQGANGKKICIKIENDLYMLKFPPIARRHDSELSYTNSCFSEHISCNIYNLLDVPAQQTLLGEFAVDGNKKIVVACKDFETNRKRFQDFGSLKNSVLTSSESGYGTELDDVLYSIEHQSFLNSNVLKERFWDMFIIDSYIGNFDRHNGNWGFLIDIDSQETQLSPVFDCGSSLFPQASENQMMKFLQDEKAIEYRTYAIPRSALKIDGVKINPYEFLRQTSNKDCLNSLEKITPKIQKEIPNIHKMIENTPYISDTHKKFIMTILQNRYEKILVPAWKQVLKKKRLEMNKGMGR